MAVEITVPELGESVLEATISRWLKHEGDPVNQGDPLVELETDKVNLEVSARQTGILAHIDRKDGEDVKVGDVLGTIDETASGSARSEVRTESESFRYESGTAGGRAPDGEKVQFQESPIPTPESTPVTPPGQLPEITPVARRMIEEQNINPSQVRGTGPGGRITKGDVENFLQRQEEYKAPSQTKTLTSQPAALTAPKTAPQPAPETTQLKPQPATLASGERREERVKMSRRRRTIAQRLVEIQQTAAMLTTFNEVDMTAVMDLRKRRGETFQDRYGVKLGFMSFFVKACIGALKAFPYLNAEIQGDEIILKYYYDIGIAVGSPEGLVVPVLHDAGQMSFAEIEKKIADFVKKTDERTLTLEDLRGGTFSITNGGIFGSLMSTPILTPPQVGILGMHKIEKRPVVIDDQVVVRPMMYLALTYDHRIVDGSEAVRFLVRVKQLIEDPESMLLEG